MSKRKPPFVVHDEYLRPESVLAVIYETMAADGQWPTVSRRFSFTFAGVFLGSVTFRCISVSRPLGEEPYRVTPATFKLLAEGAQAVHIGAQSIPSKLPRLSRLGRGLCYVPLQGKRSFIDLNGSFDLYLARFRPKTRETLRRKIRRFTQASGNGVLWREFRSPDEAAEFHNLASQVSLKTYQHRLLRAGIDTSASFAQDLALSAVEDRLRGYILFCRHIPIAYMLCERRQNDLILEKMGFDPSFAADSPGLVLLSLVLQDLFSQKEIGRFDLGEGEYPYKEQMATNSVDAAELYCFPLKFENVVFVVAHSAMEMAGALLRSALRALGVLQALKKVVRYGSMPDGRGATAKGRNIHLAK